MRQNGAIPQGQMPQHVPAPPGVPPGYDSPQMFRVGVPDARQRKLSIRPFDGK